MHAGKESALTRSEHIPKPNTNIANKIPNNLRFFVRIQLLLSGYFVAHLCFYYIIAKIQNMATGISHFMRDKMIDR